MVHYPTPGRHLRPIPSPNGAAPHAQGTFLPLSVTQRGITTRSGDISAPFRRLTAPRRTPGRHLRPIPSPSGAAAHARGTLLPRSVAQRCITARSGNTSVPFRRLTAPRRTPGRHFNPVPSPNSTKTHTWATLTPIPSPDGTAPHARGTLQPRSVASEGGERGTDGRRGRAGVWAGGRERDGDGHT